MMLFEFLHLNRHVDQKTSFLSLSELDLVKLFLEALAVLLVRLL